MVMERASSDGRIAGECSRRPHFSASPSVLVPALPTFPARRSFPSGDARDRMGDGGDGEEIR